jgi:hypothetical protein
MIGVASGTWAVFISCSEVSTLSMNRRSAVSSSWARTGSSFYSSSKPRTLPVFGLTRWVWAHARHVTWTKVRSLSSASSAAQAWALSPVTGQR